MTEARNKTRTPQSHSNNGRLLGLQHLVHATSNATGLADLCHAALQALEDTLGVNRSAVLLIDDDGVMRFKLWRGISDSYRNAVEGHSPWDPESGDFKTLAIPDVASDGSLGELRETILGEGINAVCFVPLVVRGKLIGKFMLYYGKPHSISDDEVQIAETLAGLVAFAVDRMRTEHDLQASERELRDFLETSSVAMHWVGPDGIIIWANHTELEMLGYERSEYIGRHIAEFHVDQDVIEDILARLTRGERIQEYKARLRCKDGSIRHVLIDSSVLWDEDQFIHTRCFTRDITAAKLAEDALRESESRYRRLVELAPDAIGVHADGKILYVNPAALKIIGAASPDEVIGRSMFDFLHPDYHDLAAQRAEMVQKEGKAADLEEQKIVALDGRVVDVEVVSIPVTFEGKRASQIIVRDISARKQAQAAQREAEEKYRVIFENAPYGVFQTTPEGTFVNANQALAAMLGYDSPAELMDNVKDIARDIHQDPWARSDFIRTLDQQGSVQGFEARVRRKDGDLIWVSLSGRTVRDAGGEVQYYEGIAEDISERKQAEAQLLGQHTVTRHLAESASAADALPMALESICRILEWDMAALWLVDRQAGLLRCHDIWLRPGLPVSDFVNETRSLTFRPGEGLPGGVWANREPVWIADLDPGQFIRAGLVKAAGFHSGFAAPVVVTGEVVGVVEFFGQKPRERDDRLVEAITSVAGQLGQYVRRMRAEEALHESEEQLQAIINNTTAVIYLMTPDGRFILVNRRWEELFNMSQQEVVGHSVLDHFPPEIAQAFKENNERTFAAGTAQEFEEVIPQEDGPRTYLSIKVPLYDDDGNPRALCGISTDITERKAAEDILRTRERQQAAVAELGGEALRTRDLQPLMDHAVDLLATGLDVEYTKVLELQPDGKSVLLRAGVGWREGLVGRATVPTAKDSQAGYTLITNAPVIVRDLPNETRFSGPPLLHEHGVISGMSVVIRGAEGPFGVLGIHTKEQRVFADDDVNFLQSIANVLAAAVDRVQAEDALRDSEAQHRAVLETAVDGIITIDRSGTIHSVNPAASRIFGYEPEEVIGKNVTVFMGEPEVSEHDSYLNNYLETGEKKIIGIGREVAGRRKDGSTVPLDLAVSEMLVGDQRMFTGIVRDISERKRSEEELQRLLDQIHQERQRVDNLVSNVPGVVWEAWGEPDAATQRIDFVSEFVEKMLGYTVEEWLNTPNFWLTIVHPEDRERAAAEAAAIFAGRRGGNSEFRWIAKDGRIIWVEAQSRLIRDENGQPAGMRGVTMDITERKRAEEALQASERQFRAVFDGSIDAMLIADDEGRYVEVNPSAVLLLGMPREDIIGRTIADFAEEEFDFPGAWQSFLAQGAEKGEFRLKRADGSIKHCEYAATANFLPGRHLSVMRDITQRKAAEDAIHAARERAELAVGRISRLQAVTSALAEAATPAQVGEAVLDAAVVGLNARSGFVVVLNKDAGRFEAVAMRGISRRFAEAWDQFSPNIPPSLVEAIGRGDFILAESQEELMRHFPELRWLPIPDDRAFAIVPLAMEGGTVGAVILTFNQSATPGEEEQNFTLALTRLCGQALERARLYEGERTAREQAQEAERRQTFLAEAGAILSSSLNYQSTLTSLAKLCVPYLGDWCAIDIADEELNVERVAVVHSDPAKVEMAMALQERYPPDPESSAGIYNVLRTGKPELYPDIPPELIEETAVDEEHLRLIKALGLRSAISVPLTARGRTLGVLSLVTAESGRRYTEEDMELAQELARRAALAVDNARLYQVSQRIQEELRRANEAKDEFLGMVSHELRTPITTIYGGSRLLAAHDRRLDDDSRSEIVHDIEQESERLHRLVEDLLTLARMELGQEAVLEPVLVQRVIERSVASIERRRPTRKVKVSVAADLPTANASPGYLEQILRNLLNNADKYSPDEKPIDIAARYQDGQIVISVLDRGPGIPPAEIDRIFERFYRSGQTSNQAGGAGIGLTVCRRLVEAQSGHIWAKRRRGGGLEVSFSLPVYRE